MSSKGIVYEVFGIHVLALWYLAKECCPNDPGFYACKALREARTAYHAMPSEEMERIAETLNPENWPPDESD